VVLENCYPGDAGWNVQDPAGVTAGGIEGFATATSVDGVFAAGLLPLLPDPGVGLAELARVVGPGGRLVLFHPSGRAALAARHGRRLRDDDVLAPDRLGRLLDRTGWWLARYDDGPDRFLAIAERVTGPIPSKDA
jgi:SAM-dependent methyltransferase